MATNIEAILENMRSFYDFTNRSVIHVGAGGGQLVAYARDARSVLAVDSDEESVEKLKEVVREKGWEELFTVVLADFATVKERADVVLFEFCLHEMDAPDQALDHALGMAPDVVVVDHLPDSQWAWTTCEDEKATRSWAAVGRQSVVREVSHRQPARFEDYAELRAKIEILGEPALARIEPLEGQRDIRLELGYGLALIRS
jgi:predicted RNA methylase